MVYGLNVWNCVSVCVCISAHYEVIKTNGVLKHFEHVKNYFLAEIDSHEISVIYGEFSLKIRIFEIFSSALSENKSIILE